MTRVNFELLDAVKWLKELMNEKAVETERQAQILEAVQTAAATVKNGSEKSAGEGWLSSAIREITDEVGRDFEKIVNLFVGHVAEKIAHGEQQKIPEVGKTLLFHVTESINPDCRIQIDSLCLENYEHESALESSAVYCNAADNDWHFGTVLPISRNAVTDLRDACLRATALTDIASQNRALLSIIRVAIVSMMARTDGIDAEQAYEKITEKKGEDALNLNNTAPALDRSAALLATLVEQYLVLTKRKKLPKRWSGLSDSKRTILSFVLAFGNPEEIDCLLALPDDAAYQVIHLLGNQCRCWLERPIARLPSLSRAMSKSKHLNKVANGLANQAIDNAKQLQLFAGA